MFNIHDELFDSDGQLEEEKFSHYCDQLTAAFQKSPEGVALSKKQSYCGWLNMMMDFGVNYCGESVATLKRADFEEILFDLFPRKVSTSADSASSIVTELRAFWEFIQRQYGLPNAAPILAVLTEGAVTRLHAKLSNPKAFGPAKAFFMAGMEAGYDMTTEEGMRAFQAAYNASILGPGGFVAPMMPPDMDEDEDEDEDGEGVGLGGIVLGDPPWRSRAEQDKLRKKRKAQRQAKKRNRKK